MGRDDEIEKAWIGTVPLLAGKIVLAEYDADWPVRFEHEAARIREVLRNCAMAIDHVGSTAVPRLVAKPIIDIVLAVEDAADEAVYVPPLEGLGYVLRIREPDWFQHRLLKPSSGDVNLHVFSRGCDEITRMLRFRDLLRSDPTALKRYADTKRALASREWRYMQHYADAKSTIVADILMSVDHPQS